MHYLIKNEIKRSIKSPLFLFVLVAWFFYVYRVKTQLDTIQVTAMATGVWIILFCVNGFLSMYRDKECMTMLAHTTKSALLVFTAKLIAQFLLVFCFLIPLGIYNTVIFYQYPQIATDIGWMLNESYLYLLLYYGLGGVVSTLIGMVIGLSLPNSIGMILTFLSALFIGPMGRSILSSVPYLKNIDFLFIISYFLNISQHYLKAQMDLNYGFEIEIGRFLSRFILLFVFSGIGYALLAYRFSKERKKIYPVLGVIIICCLGLCIVFSQGYFIRKIGTQKPDSRSAQELEYYYGLQSKEESAPFLITEVKGTLDARRHFEFDGEISVEAQEDLQELKLTIYRGLKIHKVVYEDQELPFSEDGDFRVINLPRTLKKGDQMTLGIRYGGYSSQHYYVGQKGILLDSRYAWLPSPGHYHAFNAEHGSTVIVALQNRNPVHYDIQILTSLPTISNLDERKPGVFTGISSNGVFIAGGRYKTRELMEFTVYYDPSWENTITGENFFVLTRNLAAVNGIYEKIGKDERVSEKANTIFFFEMATGLQNIFGTQLSYRGVYSQDYMLTPEPSSDYGDVSLYILIATLEHDIAFHQQSETIQGLFLSSISEGAIDISISKFGNLREELSQTEKNVIDILHRLQAVSQEKRLVVAKKCYQRMEKEVLTVDDFEAMLKEVEDE